ncbi:acyl-CoA thioesterase [Tomitella fengzijianii]|uniref:Acyl-CoA thioesterase n=1 Tax=Tomitella fengzijianii TaxID=2597660 RepID=A0A516X4U6_9ACTN|nr:thioesterase family protein [Tomitella fengzijianii]QDQ98074.1 acyl-CoA thioesterase [Tomitella fengzijianii]
MTEPFRVRLQLRWGDCDQLGHINNVMYLEYAQEARLRFLRELAGAAAHSIGAIVVRRVEIDFDRSLQYTAEGIDVQVWVLKVGTSSFTLRHRIFDPEGNVYSTVDAIAVAVDLESGTSRPIPDDVRRILAEQILDA